MRSISPLVALLFACAGGSASAQTFGPPIEGLCLFSRASAVSASRAGQSLQNQLHEIQASLAGGLAEQRQGIEQQLRSIEARQGTIAPIEYQRQLAALNQQLQLVERQQNARFIAAQQEGQRQIDQSLSEALGRVVTRSACSVVFERDDSYGWNNAMDITTAVTTELDALLQQVTLHD